MKPFAINSVYTVFFLSYRAIIVRRSALEVWALSKSQIKSDLKFSSALLGIYDTSYLISYAVGEYINGLLCHKIGESLVVSIGLALTGGGLLAVTKT